MKLLVLGVHLLRDDVVPPAESLAAGDLFLSALSIEDTQPVADRELLLRAATVRERLLERATFIAARYGFTASTAEEAAARCAPQLARWKETLSKYRECVEMTLKVPSVTQRERPDRKDFTSGAEYLRALHAVTRGSAVDERLRAAVEAELIPLSVASRWEQRDGKSVELAALVRRERLEEVRLAGERLRETGASFLLSGPWPLEVFADADHE